MNKPKAYFFQDFILLVALVVIALLGGCAVNPATGERHFNLVSEDQEIGMGKESDQQVVQSMGIYQDENARRYVEEMGKKLSASCERPNLPWTFRIVDDPAVNAFAIPGGYIYVTRGILTYLTSEAQLAGVMGHEVGHVTAQHSVHQMSTQQLAQEGLGLGMILKPELQQYAQLAGSGLQLLFLKFSRDDESQADGLGVRYMRRINEDPREMGSVMKMLDGYTQQAGGGTTPEWLQTHPNPGNRLEHIQQIIDTMKSPYVGTTVNTDQYLKHIDGMVFGDNPRDGFFKGNTFYQPQMKFKFDFPEGWTASNQKQSVAAISPNQDAIIQISLAGQKSPAAAADAFFSQNGMKAQRMAPGAVHGNSTASGKFTAQTDQGVTAGSATFVQMGNNVFQIVGYSGQDKITSYQSVFDRAASSFDAVTDPKILSVQPMRIKLITLDRRMTLDEFNRQYPSPISLDQLALINQVEKNAQLKAGQTMKRVVGEKP